ncbi:anti-sigma factor family protein [Limnoglobus roseus]|uniref:Uncharacterized protein n=1 Tax=Limnoglobus roseus TaxID=2598579 RepID=A0A5C1AHR5_9BACT|nr:hypothetical protein [Limnoglobus roseus]QEL18979.1 hypothetical protein PX52LOC_06029 [Limnoglobus roseus]
MSTPATPEPEDEDLVAYLDGELGDAESHAVESKLAADEEARRKAERLQKTFDLLDYLPKTEPSPHFASRTLTQINPLAAAPAPPAADARPSSSQPAPVFAPSGQSQPFPPARSGGWKVAPWFAALLISAAGGYFFHLLAKPHLEALAPARRTSEQVRLLERLPLFLGADDLDFVKQLDHPDFFGETDHDDGRASAETWTSAELVQLENLFKDFPPARQQQLRKLDEELAQQDSVGQAHLLAVLERYAIWLDRLPDNYRREVLIAPAAVERLDVIRVVKARLWRESLPAAVRDRIQQAEGPAREQLIADRKQQDSKRKLLWDLAKQEWASIRADRRPWPFENEALTKQVEEYVDKTLKPRLTNPERADLEQIRKEVAASPDWIKWYAYGNVITRMIDLHPMYPEAASGKVVKTASDLPKPFLMQLAKNGGLARRQLVNHPASGKWPDFAEAVWKEANELKVPIPSSVTLGPNKPAEYVPAVREFLENDLSRRLTKPERDELSKLESGAWPDHSRKVLDLAKKYDLTVPGVSLPGEAAKWDQVYRNRPARR